MAAATVTTPTNVLIDPVNTPIMRLCTNANPIVSVILVVYVPLVNVDGLTRKVVANPTRRWTGTAWNPAPPVPAGSVRAVRHVIPNPIRRWDGAAWVPLYVPR